MPKSSHVLTRTPHLLHIYSTFTPHLLVWWCIIMILPAVCKYSTQGGGGGQIVWREGALQAAADAVITDAGVEVNSAGNSGDSRT